MGWSCIGRNTLRCYSVLCAGIVPRMWNLQAQCFTKFSNIWRKMPFMTGPANYHESISHWLQIFVYTDKKEKQIFLIYREIQSGAVAKSYMTKACSYMTKYLRISSYIGKFYFLFYQCTVYCRPGKFSLITGTFSTWYKFHQFFCDRHTSSVTVQSFSLVELWGSTILSQVQPAQELCPPHYHPYYWNFNKFYINMVHVPLWLGK